MDVSFYISELLELHGDVSVPGLGHLVQARVSGYYNEAERKVYPPHHEVQFEPNLLDEDNVLTQYIADKKNISLASSQYFTEKYINTLKEEALTQEVPMANIGWFYTQNGHLAFRAASKLSNDPEFFGLPPVKINPIGEAPIAEPAPEPKPEPVYVPNVLIPESAAENIIQEEEEYYEEPAAKNLMRVWLILLSVILVIAIAAYGLYKYKPDTFQKLTTWHFLKATPKAELAVVDTVKVDTINHATDTVTTQNVPVTTVDSAAIASKAAVPVTNKVIKITEVTKTTTTPIASVPPAAKPVNPAPQPVTKTIVVTKPVQVAPTVVNKPVVETKPIAPPVAVNKTVVNTTKTVTTTVAPAPATTIVKGRRFEVITHAVGSMAEANRIISNYKTQGIDAHIASGVSGVGIKVSVGTYGSLDEAEVAMTQLIASGKISKDAYPIEIKR